MSHVNSIVTLDYIYMKLYILVVVTVRIGVVITSVFWLKCSVWSQGLLTESMVAGIYTKRERERDSEKERESEKEESREREREWEGGRFLFLHTQT